MPSSSVSGLWRSYGAQTGCPSPSRSGRRDVDALAALLALQCAMADRGYPAPVPLTGLTELGPGLAVAMSYDRSGEPTDARLPGVRRAMAAGLLQFIAEAQAARGALA